MVSNQDNYMTELGLSSTGGKKASATFVPEPRKNYQIQHMHMHIYYLTFGDYVQGSIIDVSKTKAPKMIDFYMNPADVTVIHDENGKLKIQRQ